MLVRLFDAASKLKRQAISQIRPEVLFEMADAMEAPEGMGVRVDCFDEVVRRILKVKDH